MPTAKRKNAKKRTKVSSKEQVKEDDPILEALSNVSTDTKVKTATIANRILQTLEKSD